MTILNEIIEYKKTLLERKYYDKNLKFYKITEMLRGES